MNLATGRINDSISCTSISILNHWFMSKFLSGLMLLGYYVNGNYYSLRDLSKGTVKNGFFIPFGKIEAWKMTKNAHFSKWYKNQKLSLKILPNGMKISKNENWNFLKARKIAFIFPNGMKIKNWVLKFCQMVWKSQIMTFLHNFT